MPHIEMLQNILSFDGLLMVVVLTELRKRGRNQHLNDSTGHRVNPDKR